MSKSRRILSGMSSVFMLLVFFYPYKYTVVPAARIEVVDEAGRERPNLFAKHNSILWNHLRVNQLTLLGRLLAMVPQRAIADHSIANSQAPSLSQLRTDYAMRFLEPVPHMALAKYFSEHGNRLQAFYILETARRGWFKEEEFDKAFAQVFRGVKTPDYSEASERALTAEHARDPNSIDTLVKLADIYISRKDWAKAKEYISEAIRVQPEDSENTNALAEVFRREGKWEEADRLLATTRTSIRRLCPDTGKELRK